MHSGGRAARPSVCDRPAWQTRNALAIESLVLQWENGHRAHFLAMRCFQRGRSNVRTASG